MRRRCHAVGSSESSWMGMLRVDVGPPDPGGLEEDEVSSLPDSDILDSVVEPSSFAFGTLEADGAPPEPPARPRGVSLN